MQLKDSVANNGHKVSALPETNGTDRGISNKPHASDFAWGAGIECSFVPHLGVDQFEWTQHNRFWKDDFKLARDLGLSRTAICVSMASSRRDCPANSTGTWPTSALRYAQTLGIELCLDVMHFGTPKWLGQAAGDPEFPEALERFTDALVTRYRGCDLHVVSRATSRWCWHCSPGILASGLRTGEAGAAICRC